jgi:hypothetical protein
VVRRKAKDGKDFKDGNDKIPRRSSVLGVPGVLVVL